MLKVLDLFSGIGGFSLGLERTGGFETVAFCEIDAFCRKVLAKHWPGVPIYEDVKGLRHDGPVDVVCGGFPCQPFSHAGKRGGVEDDRYLWPPMLEVIEAHRPTWVIGENVAGLTSMGGADSSFEVESRSCIRTDDEDNYHSVRSRQEILLLRTIIGDLEQAAYAVQTFVIPACAVDAPHRRDRVWIVAHAEHRGVSERRGNEGTVKDVRQSPGIHCDVTQGSEQQARTLLANADRSRSQGHRRLRKCAGERLAGAGRGAIESCWLPEPDVGRVAHGVPMRVDRLKSLGNAVVPQITEILGRAIIEAEQVRAA